MLFLQQSASRMMRTKIVITTVLVLMLTIGSIMTMIMLCFVTHDLNKMDVESIYIKNDFREFLEGETEIFEITEQDKHDFLEWFFPYRALSEDPGDLDHIGHISKIIFVLKDRRSVLITVPQQAIGSFTFWIDNKSCYRFITQNKHAYDYDWVRFIIKCHNNSIKKSSNNRVK